MARPGSSEYDLLSSNNIVAGVGLAVFGSIPLDLKIALGSAQIQDDAWDYRAVRAGFLAIGAGVRMVDGSGSC